MRAEQTLATLCPQNVVRSPKTGTFQIRINPLVKKRAEEVYAQCGLTLTEAINVFIQQSLNVQGLPFTVTSKASVKQN